MSKIRNKGFSLLEILLVLAIAAAVVIAAFIIYPKVTAEKTADSEAKRVMMIAAAARSLYTSKANYSGLTFDVLKNADLIDKGMFAKMDEFNFHKMQYYFYSYYKWHLHFLF